MEIAPTPQVTVKVVGPLIPLTKNNIESVLTGEINTHSHPGGSGSTFAHIGPTPPNNPIIGQLWIDTTLA
jgi:hypothetical protein